MTTHLPGTPYEDDVWRLYDTNRDFSECHDLAAGEPERVAALCELWEEQAAEHGVFPLDDRPLKDLLSLGTGQGLHSAERVVLEAGAGHMPAACRTTGSNRSMRVTARLRRRADGVILASGTSAGGYVLYTHNDHLVFEHHLLGRRICRTSPQPLPSGPAMVGFRLQCRADRSARFTLEVESQAVAEADIPRTASRLSGFGLDVGRDTQSQVSTAYTDEFPQPDGALIDVELQFTGPEDMGELADALEATE